MADSSKIIVQRRLKTQFVELPRPGRLFSFEELEVWQKAVDYARAVMVLAEKISARRRHYRLIEQLEASAVSIERTLPKAKDVIQRKSSSNFFILRAARSMNPSLSLPSSTGMEIFPNKNWMN